MASCNWTRVAPTRVRVYATKVWYKFVQFCWKAAVLFDQYVFMRLACRVAHWLSGKFQSKEAQLQLESWTEKVSKCLADIVQVVGSFSDKPYGDEQE